MKHLTKAAVVVALIGATVFGFKVLPADAATNPCTTGNTTQMPTGVQTSPYDVGSPPNNETYDGYDHINTTPDEGHPNHAIKLGGTTVPGKVCLGGPVVNGGYSFNISWSDMHDIGGSGTQMFSQNINEGGMTIDDVEDGAKMQNCAEDSLGDVACRAQQPGGQFNIQDVRFMNIRDDGIDDDDCMPGNIDNVLFEGHTFFSEQEEDSSTGLCVSSGETPTINITNTYIRLVQSNAYNSTQDQHDGAGQFFKDQVNANGPNHVHHTLSLTHVVLAVDEQPRSGWDTLDMPGFNGKPGDVTWHGTDNWILYLNKGDGPEGVESYGGPMPGEQGIPTSVHYLAGQQARDKWEEVRNKWLTDHNCSARPAGDLNPKDDPVGHCVAPK